MATALVALQALAIIIGGAWAVWLLHRSVNDRRAEWLWNLSSEFRKDRDFQTISLAIEQGAWPSSADRLDSYLNFLETVAVLADMHQFDREQAHKIFGYWVEAIGALPEARAYLEDFGYEYLLAWAAPKRLHA